MLLPKFAGRQGWRKRGGQGGHGPSTFQTGGAKLSNGPPTICAPKRENKWYFLKNSPAALNWLYFTQNVRLRLKISCVLRKNFACGAKSVVFYSELLDFHNFCTKIQKFFGGFVPMKPCWTGHASLGRSGPLTIFELPPCLIQGYYSNHMNILNCA